MNQKTESTVTNPIVMLRFLQHCVRNDIGVVDFIRSDEYLEYLNRQITATYTGRLTHGKLTGYHVTFVIDNVAHGFEMLATDFARTVDEVKIEVLKDLATIKSGFFEIK